VLSKYQPDYFETKAIFIGGDTSEAGMVQMRALLAEIFTDLDPSVLRNSADLSMLAATGAAKWALQHFKKTPNSNDGTRWQPRSHDEL
jgi:hypothetical protein